MKMFLVRLAFAGAFVIAGSDASVARFSHPPSTQTVRPSAGVAARPRTIQVVDVDCRLSDQERSLLAFVRLKADAERRAR
jgi:hypothetical protein